MTVGLEQTAAGRVVKVRVTGRITKEDFEHFAPRVEMLIERYGKIRMLVELRDFQGWTVGALWEDIKFDFKHFKDLDRLAIVGESKWEKGMATFCKPFTTAEVRYFDQDRIDAARKWVEADLPPASSAAEEGRIDA